MTNLYETTIVDFGDHNIGVVFPKNLFSMELNAGDHVSLKKKNNSLVITPDQYMITARDFMWDFKDAADDLRYDIQLAPSADEIDLPHEVLERLVQSIVDAIPTKAIYIYGSYARGDEGKRSNINIYVITNDDAKSTYEYSLLALGSLSWLRMEIDIQAASEDKFKENSEMLWMPENDVIEEGKLIYESQP
ncbi:MAG: nucleotidyltransferase domain-containing protein [Eggerthellaceae bacterium]|nr:nucleotidyltransferase domain-containing protein [Eggerthellaceae bacterium]